MSDGKKVKELEFYMLLRLSLCQPKCKLNSYACYSIHKQINMSRIQVFESFTTVNISHHSIETERVNDKKEVSTTIKTLPEEKIE